MPKAGADPIMQCGREITAEELEDIQETVEMFWRLSRTELAQTICEHLGWYRASGRNKVDACLKLLEKLESQGKLQLPEKQEHVVRNKAQHKGPYGAGTEPQADIIGSLRDLGSVKLEVVSDEKTKKLWNEYMSRHHYLGYKKPFGYHMRYFIQSDRGILGCILMAGPAKSMRRRDRWIGWTEEQRLRNLAWVINNARFLILPWVRVRNLASHTLGQLARRVRQDWQDRWGYRPVLMETFVDPQQYSGSSYRAANWIYVGMTTGEGLVRPGKSYTTTPKRIFVMPLVDDFRAVLCSERLTGCQEE
jgi:hypothetical protein